MRRSRRGIRGIFVALFAHLIGRDDVIGEVVDQVVQVDEVEGADPSIFEVGGDGLIAVEGGDRKAGVVEHWLALNACTELSGVLCDVEGQKVPEALPEIFL